MKTLTYEVIKEYIEKGLISERPHPEDSNVRIFNYTKDCQYTMAWDDVTRACRGLIMNVATGEVIARPFPKFHNYSEFKAFNWPVPETKPIVMDKLDGNLGILCEVNGKQWIATRGSFTSEQAKSATRWWRENMKGYVLNKDETHLFEIIFPQHKIVVNYDFTGLVYLTSIKTSTGEAFEVPWEEPMRVVNKVDCNDLEELMKLDTPNSEGFVLYFPESETRMKIKFPEYLRLHKIVTNVSEIGIWEVLRDGGSLDQILQDVPDEFFDWVTQVRERIMSQYKKIEAEGRAELEDALSQSFSSRKDLALIISKKKHSSLCFMMLDEKNYQKYIWKLVRPHGLTTFKVDIDN